MAPLLLLGGLQKLNFNFWGWQSFDVKSEANFQNDSSVSQQWFTQYSGFESQLQPEKLRLSLEFEQRGIMLISEYTQNSEVFLREHDGG